MLWLFLGYFNEVLSREVSTVKCVVCFEPSFHIKQHEKMQDLLKTQGTQKKAESKAYYAQYSCEQNCLCLGRENNNTHYFLFSYQLICPQVITLVLR